MMQPYQGTKEKWNAFVAANAEDGGVLQSWEWGELEEREGHRVWRLAWESAETPQSGESGGPATMPMALGGEKGELVAICLLVDWTLSPLPAGPRHRFQRDPANGGGQRRWPFGWKYLYAPRGPVFKNPNDQIQISNILKELEKFAREHGAVFLRIEPPYSKSRNLEIEKSVRTQSVQPHQTLRIDLTQSEDALLKAMHQKTRYNIGLSEKHGVRVEEKNDIEAFFKLLQTTTTRDGFRMHPREHYETILATLDAKLFFASHNGQPLATALVAFFGATAYYLHGASANEHRDVMAPYALHWEIMRKAKRRGCTTYDLWGVDEKRWPGVTRFKQGFAPNTPFTTYAGTYDLPLRKIPYTLYRLKKLL